MKRKIVRVFGFVANPSLSSSHNAIIRLANMAAWFYFERPTHTAMHNLCSEGKPPMNLKSLLGLNLKFIPRPLSRRTNIDEFTSRFRRDISVWSFFAGTPMADDNFNKKLHITSKWKPPEHKLNQVLMLRTDEFIS